MSCRSMTRGVAVLALGFGLGTSGGRALAQSTADMPAEPGSTITVTMDLTIGTDAFGTLSDSDTDTASVTGASLMTLFPTDPAFMHATTHSLILEVGTLSFNFSFVFGFVRIDITVTDLVIQSTDAFNGTIGGGGAANFPAAPLRVTGTAHIVSSALGVDQLENVDEGGIQTLDVRITATGGIVTLDQINLLPVHAEVDPADLPAGVTSVVVDLTFNTSNLALSGPYSPSVFGDTDADGDVDIDDYPAFADCVTGPTGVASIYCSLHDFDQDSDVDLFDFADFAATFSSP